MQISGTKGYWNFRISDQVKNPDGTAIYPCAEFRRSPEDPVSQIHSPRLGQIPSPRWGPWDILRFSKVCSDAKERERERERESGVWKAMGSYRTYSIPFKTAALVPEFVVEDPLSAELQSRLLRLQ